MKPETSERLFIEELFNQSIKENKIDAQEIKSIERLTGDASTRRYYRVFCLKCSYVVCLDNPTEDDNLFVKKQRFFEHVNVRVPKVYHSIPTKGYILEEDLGDVTLLQDLVYIKNSDEELSKYKKIIDELVKIHSKKIEHDNQKLFNEKFDLEKYMSEVDFSLRYFFKTFLKIDEQPLIDGLNNEFEKICIELATKNMVLTHRDFHSRNVMVKEDDLIIIDFQDARMGLPQYDLASLLDDCYYQMESNNKEVLIKYYYDQMEGLLVDQPKYEEFRALYDKMVLQRAFKAIGSFSYIYEHRKDERYVKYIGFAMEKIRSILLTDSSYNELRSVLFKAYYDS